jgi:spermidine/putrescine-binding protein
MLTRRAFLRRGALAAAAGTAGLTVRPGRAAAADELRVMFPGGTWREYFEKVYTGPFTAQHGTKFIWRTGLSQEPIVIAQRRSPQWDLIHMNQTKAMALGVMTMVAEWKDDRMPNLGTIHPSFRYQYIAGKVHTPYGLAYNTRRVTRKIDSWTDLWDPAFAGKVSFPTWEWVGDEVFYACNRVFGGNEGEIQPGIAKFKELFGKNKAVLGNNVEHVIQLLVSEEVWITPFFSARARQAKAKGAPIEFVIPKEGGLSWVWNTAIIANRPAPSMRLAEQFADFTLAPEREVEFAKLTGYPPTSTKAMAMIPADFPHLRLTDAELTALGKLQREFDHMAIFALRDQAREQWNKEAVSAK